MRVEGEAAQQQQVAGKLAGPLGMTAAAILSLIQNPTSPQYVVLAQNVSSPAWSQIAAMNLPGISDTASYAAYGRIAAQGGNPYTTTPQQWLLTHHGTAYYQAIGVIWKNTASVYGPLATWIQHLAASIGGANVVTTVTTTLVALPFIGSRAEFRRALGASTIHDFYNWLALLIFFPIELIWHPLERISGALTNALYGTGWLPDPARFNFVRAATRPVEDGVIKATSHLSATLGPLFTIVIGAALILVAVRYLGKLLKLLMVGRARDILIKAVGGNAYLAMASGMGVTVLTQSSTITTSVLVPFARAGILTPAQVYPVTVGANLGTTFTTIFAAFAVVGPDAKIGLQAAFVHLLYNVFAIIVIYVIPVLRPVPLFCAETLARIAAERKWVVAVYLITVFIVLPALVIILIGVL